MSNHFVEIGSDVFSGTFSKIGDYAWVGWVIGGLIIIGILIYVAVSFKKGKDRWNLTVRIRQEDTINKNLDIDPKVIRARRITLSNGIKMMLLEKSILGKRLMPLLNYYTRPGIYDLILTADNRIFIITGVEGIDVKRKKLNVSIRYPGIDQDFDELNIAYAQLNKDDLRSNLLDIIKAASIGILAICILIAVIVGGKYWVDAKEADSRISQANVEVIEQLRLASIQNNEFATSMNLLIPKLEELYGTRNLNRQIEINNQEAQDGSG